MDVFRPDTHTRLDPDYERKTARIEAYTWRTDKYAAN